jgi:hypothetical protein
MGQNYKSSLRRKNFGVEGGVIKVGDDDDTYLTVWVYARTDQW